MNMINRSASIASHEGRTLLGMAYYFERASRVTDDGRNFYLEAFGRQSATKSITDRARFAVGILHPWSPGAKTSPIPVGAVTFANGRDGLEFEAVLSRTRDGDEALELVSDGALRDVSISARPIRSSKRGDTTYRDEVALRELSLAPPGMGLHEGAEILAVRAEIEHVGTPLLDESQRRLRLLLL